MVGISQKTTMAMPTTNSPASQRRRHILVQLAGLAGLMALPITATALMPGSLNATRFDATQQLSGQESLNFRNWFQLIVLQQLKQGPTPRWQQKDCAGLVRFATAEALRVHDDTWLKANGFLRKKTPPDLNLPAEKLATLRHAWRRADGTQGAFVSALELVQNNTSAIGKDMAHAEIADLLLFNQGQQQHLMVWMGRYLAYHTGTVKPNDNGLRAYPLSTLMSWDDTRWQPHANNPNFIGIFRLFFLRA